MPNERVNIITPKAAGAAPADQDILAVERALLPAIDAFVGNSTTQIDIHAPARGLLHTSVTLKLDDLAPAQIAEMETRFSALMDGRANKVSVEGKSIHLDLSTLTFGGMVHRLSETLPKKGSEAHATFQVATVGEGEIFSPARTAFTAVKAALTRQT